MSRVSPVYKEDIKSDPNKLQTNIYFFNYRKELNYKKIIEKIVFGQRYGYLVENNLLVHSEHDFRPLHFNKRGCLTLPIILCKHAHYTCATKFVMRYKLCLGTRLILFSSLPLSTCKPVQPYTPLWMWDCSKQG